MLYNYEADHSLIKLLGYGDLLHKLILVESRTDFNFKRKPLGFSLIKHLPELRRWLDIIDHGEVECYDDSENNSEVRGRGKLGAHGFAWEEENFGRAAVWQRLQQLNLQDDDVIVITDSDEVLCIEFMHHALTM